MTPEFFIVKICPDVPACLLNTAGLGASKRRRQQTILPFQILNEDKSCPYWTENSSGLIPTLSNTSQGFSFVVIEATKSLF